MLPMPLGQTLQLTLEFTSFRRRRQQRPNHPKPEMRPPFIAALTAPSRQFSSV
jgi:hypothetical protein